MKNIVLLLLAAMPLPLMAQKYATVLIPDSLKKNADVVKRYDELTLEIKSPGKATVHEHHVYTVLNESGSAYGKYDTYYGKFNSINSATCILYDATGRELKRVKKKDMQDLSVADGISLMTDERYKSYDFYNRTYPYTVDFEEEDDYDGILHFSDWVPIGAPGMSVQYSTYVIIAPKDYQVRYKQLNCAVQPVITETAKTKIYTWEIKNLPAISMESLCPSWREIVPCVMFAPSDFEAEGYKGNMSTWENYGKFIYQLVKGRDLLPEETRKKVHALTDNLKDDRLKVYALYDFMQKNTHYISVQLGIGGWQPFDANYVATKNYGDCKALSNYMVALLKEAGIAAKYVEIMAGDNALPVMEDFPSSQFNHVISCVPMGKDTIWLECTSQTKSPGYMGSFTGGRKAVLIDENGGHIVNTPSYASADNLQYRVADAVIDANGNLMANVNTTYTGIQHELPDGLMNEASKEERDKYLNRMFNLPTYEVDKSTYEEQKSKIPVVKEYLHITSPNYANISSKRLFIASNLFNKNTTRFSTDSARKYDILWSYAFKDIDSISVKIPDGYVPESVPQDVTINSKFGKYKASVKVKDNKIVYYRSREQYSGRYAAKEYADLVNYFDQMYKTDHSRIVLVKKE